jgi:hypothetical protein
MSTLNWTTEKPTKPGWYWYREDPTASPKLVFHGLVWDAVADVAGRLPKSITFERDQIPVGEWAGPLEPPLSGQSR